jgi:hypothetical protein
LRATGNAAFMMAKFGANSLYLREKRGRLVKKNLELFSFSLFLFSKCGILKSTSDGLFGKNTHFTEKSRDDVEIYDF